jgi:hypothetical protein
VSVVLDVAWLPTSLTSLKLTGMTLSCTGNRTYMEGRGAVYAAALLQVSNEWAAGLFVTCKHSSAGGMLPHAEQD